MGKWKLENINSDFEFTAVDGAKKYMEKYTEGIGLFIRDKFEFTVKDWTSAPPVVFMKFNRRALVGVSGAQGQIFHIVNYGRDPKKSWIRYGKIPAAYDPATIKGSLGHFGAQEYPPYRQVTKENPEQHPGIKARRFDETIFDLASNRGITNISKKSLSDNGMSVSLEEFFGRK